MTFKERSEKEKALIISRCVFQVILGLLFIVAGAPKLFINHEMWVTRFEGWGYPGNFHYVVGFLELGGALLLFVPKYVLYSAGMLSVIMIGAIFTVLMNNEPVASPLVFLILLLVLLLLSYLTKDFSSKQTHDAIE